MPRWLVGVVEGYRRLILPHLAMALFLVCGLEALETIEPKWLKSTNTAAIRLVLALDDGLDDIELPPLWLRERLPDSLVAKLGVWRPFESTLTAKLQAAPTQDAASSVTIVSLTPAAYGHYLNRTSPIPRGPLACVILALSQRLMQIQPAAPDGRPDKNRLPVVAIDIDVTPVEGSATWPTPDRWAGCTTAIATLQTIPNQAASGAAQDADQAMLRVLNQLATHSRVVAINYPLKSIAKPDTRDTFINDFCCRPPTAASASSTSSTPQASKPSCIYFASPHLMYGAQDLVYEYATTLRDRRSRPGQPASGADGMEPQRFFPGLGQVMSSAMPDKPDMHERPQSATKYNYCEPLDVAAQSRQNDNLLTTARAASIVNAYDYSPIALGLARSSVSYFDIDHDKAAEQDNWKELDKLFQNLPVSGMYILTIDSGTTEDKFQVPGSDAPVPGAWLHAAIAVTEDAASRQSASEASREQALHRFFSMGRDLLFGLVFVLTVDASTGWLRRPKNPVIHDIGVVCLPLLLAVVFLYIQVLWWVAPEYAAHRDQPSMLLLVGMLVDLYLDACAEKWPHVRRRRLRWSAKRMQEAGQWTWATAIVVSCVVVAWPDPPIWGGTLLIGALAGAIYVALAHNVKVLPLPWSARSNRRPKCTHP